MASLIGHVLGVMVFAVGFSAVLALLILGRDFSAFGAFFDQTRLLS